MTLEEYAYLAQIIGTVFVIITLVYLSVQIRQGTNLLRSESRQAQLTNDQNGVYLFVENPEMGKIFSQEEPPTFSENTKLQFWIVGQMRTREHEWLQYKSGALDEDSWLSYKGVIYFLLGTPRARKHWELCCSFFNPDFVKMVSEMMKGAPCIDYWEKLDSIR